MYGVPVRSRSPIGGLSALATTRSALPSVEESSGQVKGGVACLLERFVAKVATVLREAQQAIAALAAPGPPGDHEQYAQLVVRESPGDRGEVSP
jgi:hypothetical protein